MAAKKAHKKTAAKKTVAKKPAEKKAPVEVKIDGCNAMITVHDYKDMKIVALPIVNRGCIVIVNGVGVWVPDVSVKPLLDGTVTLG